MHDAFNAPVLLTPIVGGRGPFQTHRDLPNSVFRLEESRASGYSLTDRKPVPPQGRSNESGNLRQGRSQGNVNHQPRIPDPGTSPERERPEMPLNCRPKGPRILSEGRSPGNVANQAPPDWLKVAIGVLRTRYATFSQSIQCGPKPPGLRFPPSPTALADALLPSLRILGPLGLTQPNGVNCLLSNAPTSLILILAQEIASLGKLSPLNSSLKDCRRSRFSVTAWMQTEEAIAKPSRRSTSGFRNGSEPALPSPGYGGQALPLRHAQGLRQAHRPRGPRGEAVAIDFKGGPSGGLLLRIPPSHFDRLRIFDRFATARKTRRYFAHRPPPRRVEV
jgi:hypothetical protein